MMSTARTLYEFFSSFGIPAYVENNVPDDAALPYITYELVEPDSLSQASFTARVWYMDESFAAITAKVDEIKQAIGWGRGFPVDGGVIWIWRDTNFCQFQPPDEPKIKIAYLSMIISCAVT